MYKPSIELRRARVAVSLLFLTNGAIFANLLPRYPSIKSELGLSNATFGLAVAAFPFGALIAGLAAAGLIRRFRSSRVAVVASLLLSAGVIVAGFAPSWWSLAAALFFAGAMDSLTDVGQNSHGLRVQRHFRRSIINSFHAVWSIGAVTGGLMGSAAAGLDIPLGLHLSVSSTLFACVALFSYSRLLPGPEDEGRAAESAGEHDISRRPKVSWRTYGILGALVLISVSGALTEDAGNSWSAIYLSGSLGAAASVAGLGYVAMTGMQFIGRITGDRLVDLFGQRRVAQVGGAVTAVGMGIALAFPSTAATIVGFGAAGLGMATLIPAAMHAADELPGFKAGSGLTILSWLMRLGFLLSPPIIGAIADATSLRVGLLVIPVAGLLALSLSPVLAGKLRERAVHTGG